MRAEIEDVKTSHMRIRNHIFHTPFLHDVKLSDALGCHAYLKMEMQQCSGSFKARGAFNKILFELEQKRDDSPFFIAASTGNHAVAFCHVLSSLGLQGKVFLPENVSTAKLSIIKSMGVEFELVGKNSLATEVYARGVADATGHTLVHPYNDSFIISGQGTVALEMLQEVSDLDVIVAPVGGGGLISGICLYAKSIRPEVVIVGCQPLHSPEMVRSIERGEIISEEISMPTLSDGTAGGMEQGSITFDICRELVDEWALITEAEIAFEIREMVQNNQLIIEGASALPLAFLRKNADRFKSRKVGLVMTGKRIGYDRLRELIC